MCKPDKDIFPDFQFLQGDNSLWPGVMGSKVPPHINFDKIKVNRRALLENYVKYCMDFDCEEKIYQYIGSIPMAERVECMSNVDITRQTLPSVLDYFLSGKGPAIHVDRILSIIRKDAVKKPFMALFNSFYKDNVIDNPKYKYNLYSLFQTVYNPLCEHFKLAEPSVNMGDQLTLMQHAGAIRIFIGVLFFIVIEHPDIRLVLESEDDFKMIYYMQFIMTNYEEPKTLPVFDIPEDLEPKFHKWAIRKLSFFWDYSSMIGRTREISMYFQKELAEEIHNSMAERFKNNPRGVSVENWGFIVTYCSDMLAMRENISSNVDSLISREWDSFFYGLLKQDYKDLNRAVKERYNEMREQDAQDIRQELSEKYAQEISELQVLRAENERLKREKERLSEVISDKKNQIQELESDIEEMCLALDEVHESMSEEERENSEFVVKNDSEPLSKEEIEFLNSKKIVVVGGHGNFHRLLLNVVGNWRCVGIKRYCQLAACERADLVVFMANYMTHSMGRTTKSICAANNMRYVSLNSNNVNRCLHRILEELRPKE